jgi:hypothetical protein
MLKAALAGIASQIPVLDKVSDSLIYRRRRTLGTISADYCYSIWLRHLVHAHEAGVRLPVSAIAELGPGSTIGVGIAALLCGATDVYYALDVVDNAPDSDNLRLFDELVEMFRNRAPVPGPDQFPKLKPSVDSYEFPRHILTDRMLDAALAPTRLEAICRALEAPSSNGPITVRYIAPWFDATQMAGRRVDWILSQAVLEHVDDLDQAYQAFAEWLAPNGLMTHEIDFKCHNTARTWNGHWAYSELVWKRVFRGKRVYLINRQPVSTHRRLLEAEGFDCLKVAADRQPSAIERRRLAASFAANTDEDLSTSSAFMMSRRAA